VLLSRLRLESSHWSWCWRWRWRWRWCRLANWRHCFSYHCLPTISDLPSQRTQPPLETSIVVLVRVPHCIPQSCAHDQAHYHQKSPMSAPRRWCSKTQDWVLTLTPTLGGIVFLHHEWDHVQLLLVAVVSLHSTLSSIAGTSMHTRMYETAVLSANCGGQTGCGGQTDSMRPAHIRRLLVS
jgi:hypothetical protein